MLETAPGRIEAVVLAPGSQPIISGAQAAAHIHDEAALSDVRAEIDRIVKATNQQLGVHQRIDAWRLWPDPDFPRTHTLKIRRDAVREWAVADAPLPVREEAEPVAAAR